MSLNFNKPRNDKEFLWVYFLWSLCACTCPWFYKVTEPIKRGVLPMVVHVTHSRIALHNLQLSQPLRVSYVLHCPWHLNTRVSSSRCPCRTSNCGSWKRRFLAIVSSAISRGVLGPISPRSRRRRSSCSSRSCVPLISACSWRSAAILDASDTQLIPVHSDDN